MFQSAVIRDEYEFTGHNSALGAVCYNRHQDTFVSVDESCLRLWRAPGGQLRQVNLPARTSRFIQAIAYIDARQLFAASALDGALRLYDPNLNEFAALFTGRGTVLSMVFDGQHNRLLTGGVDGCAAWQIKPKPSGMPEGALNAHYEFTPLPKFFHGTAVSNSKRTKAHSSKQLKPSRTSVERAGWVESMQLGPESTRLYAQTRQWIDVFSTVDGAHLERWDDLFPAEHGTMTAFVVQERAKYLVCGTSSGVIVVLSHHPISIVHTFKDHTQTITSLTEHATSRLVISSSLDGSVRLWDLEARRQAHRLNVGHGVHALQLLPPPSILQAAGSAPRPAEVELAGRFCCQLRNTIKIYDILSILKEHQPCLAPVSILQRVVFPTKGVLSPQPTKKTLTASPSGEQVGDDSNEDNDDETSGSDDEKEDSDDACAPVAAKTQQLVVVVCMDKTLRVFAGRTANEAPSFSWIPDEQALDLVAFALHPVSQHLFLLLSSQKLLIVSAAPRRRKRSTQEGATEEADGDNAEIDTHEVAEATTSSIERVIDLSATSTAQKATGVGEPGGSKSRGLLKGSNNASNDALSTDENAPTGSSTGSTRGSSTSKTALRCICVCPFPPVFTAAPSTWLNRPLAGQAGAGRSSTTRQRRQSQFGPGGGAAATAAAAAPIPPLRRRNALVQSEWEWVACGNDLGQLLFWHTGLRGGRDGTLTLDAHDAPIVDISASAASPLLVSLDAAGRVHLWSLQPQFALRHVLELGQSPSVFALSPLSEIILSGYDDGRIVLHAVGYQAASVEALTGADDHHSTTVSAGDFLDEKYLVLTASVDAIVKVWDQQRVLLRQVTLATAVTSLCFLNADGDLLAGLSKGTFFISRRDVLPDKMPKPAPRRRIRAGPQGPKTEALETLTQSPSSVSPLKSAPSAQDSPPAKAAGSESTALPPQQNLSVSSRPPDPESSAKQLLAHVIQRPIEAANHLRPPVLRTYSSSGRIPSSRVGSFSGNNSSERQTAALSSSDPATDQLEEDWRDQILPLSAYQKLMRTSQRGASYRRKRCQMPLVLRTLGPSPRSALAKRRSSREIHDEERQNSADNPPTLGLGVGVGSADAPLLYCKHQAPVPPKDKTPRKLWNAIGGEDRRLIVLQRSHLPPC
ncbi:hypothetical protein PF005_g16117 [Phytophthora fragariae]|uniref:Uncharacterized protein n=1 Tax=Phytophthora fragariae TaxID=53985 RepID=A0A6A3JMD6_9STRA|nr:hypothetical protein PF003_g7059 [Phytophthora fragariae]KAE8931785.1 hypothetical protein PF009_g18163 [Phytophthora fragariae]KAE8996230.1 hypothetical protein PF011_g15987 [Phytophthora fragariae]KAE9094844.1 hypothetical protein PF007_g17613 [Phytophthora fragariae]KAE9095807.1 hypothetical protein PF010_g16565 [Phytophthora fragariae]